MSLRDMAGGAASFIKAAAQLETEKTYTETMDKYAKEHGKNPEVATSISEHINIVKERAAQNRARKTAAKWAYTFPEGNPEDMSAEDLMTRVKSTVYTSEKAFQKDDFVSKDGSVHRLDVYAKKPDPVKFPTQKYNAAEAEKKKQKRRQTRKTMLTVGKYTLAGVGLGWGVLKKYNPYLSMNVTQPQVGR